MFGLSLRLLRLEQRWAVVVSDEEATKSRGPGTARRQLHLRKKMSHAWHRFISFDFVAFGVFCEARGSATGSPQELP